MGQGDRCPYCGVRQRLRATCGHWECQFKRHQEKSRAWWRKNGKVYNGMREEVVVR